jgi:hypothetical protein
LPWWGGKEGGTGSSQNSCHLPWVTRNILPMLSIKEFIIKMEGNTGEFLDISGSEIH